MSELQTGLAEQGVEVIAEGEVIAYRESRGSESGSGEAEGAGARSDG